MKRFYLGEFCNPGYVKGLEKWLVLHRGKCIGEDDAAKIWLNDFEDQRQSLIIVFEGLKNYFTDILHDHIIVREELFRIVSPKVLENLARIDSPFIAMHVRRGDVVQPGLTQMDLLSKRHYTPIEWFISAARAVRQDKYWSGFPIFVVSDGQVDELAELIAIPGCELVTLGTAIGDMLLLSKARLMFGTAHSTFSMWGSYVGRVPTLYCSGKMDQNVFPQDSGIVESEWEEGVPLPQPT